MEKIQYVYMYTICICVITAQSSNAQSDLTEVSDQKGAHVVRAVLSRIEASEVFEKSSQLKMHAFMRRLAYVLTEDGHSTSDYSDGGIWDISNEMLQITKTLRDQMRFPDDGNLENVYQNLTNYFGFNWETEVRLEDMRIPIYSGLAMRLLILFAERDPTNFVENSVPTPSYIGQNPVPGYSNQRDYWINYLIYPKPTSSNPFVLRWNTRIETELNDFERCRVDADVVFVLDTSGSIMAANFERVREYAINFISKLKSETGTSSTNGTNRVGVISYSNFATIHANLSDNLNEVELTERIRLLPYNGGSTNTPDGICKMANQQWRGRERLVLRLGVVLTDGMANWESRDCGNLTQAVKMAKNKGILLYAVGVGRGVRINELIDIASSSHFVDHVDSFTGLEQAQEDRSYEICFLTATPVQVGNESHITVGGNGTERLSFSTLLEEGITIRICITAGRLLLYASTTVRNPSEALSNWQGAITTVNLTSINCLTSFFHNVHNKRRKRAVTESERGMLYLTIEGVENSNEFTVNSENGNVTFDSDECEQEPYPCTNLTRCINTDGSFYCMCRTGYMGDGEQCEDVDECELNPCADLATCENTNGSFYCVCPPGFLIVNGTECEDINECDEDPGPCPKHQVCVNTNGGFGCSVNNQVVALSVTFTVGPLILVVTAIILGVCCCKISNSKKGHKHKSDAASVKSDENVLVKDEDDDDDWNYTMTITWQEKEDKSKN